MQVTNYCYDISLDPKGQICSFMFANPQSIALAAEFCDVILTDCTQKTKIQDVHAQLCRYHTV